MNTFVYYQLFVAIVIFFIALGGSLYPVLSSSQHNESHVLLYGEYIARGIFLGAGLIHLLPDAINSFNAAFPNTHYPIIEMLCAFTIFFLYLIEQGLSGIFQAKNQHESVVWLPYVIVIMLSVHSLIEGAVLGVETTLTNFVIIAFAIIAHKAADGFALGISLPNNHFSKSLLIKLMIVFALLTPLGMFAGVALHRMLTAGPGNLATAIFNAIATGTFIYIATNSACLHQHQHQHEHETSAFYELLYFSGGLILMAVVAIWL